MRRVLTILGCCFFLAPTSRGEDVIFPGDDIPASQLGGLIIIRQGNQTTVSLGGVLFPRIVKVTTATPEGPVVARFQFPSAFHTPVRPPLPGAAPAFLRVALPDPDGILYVEGELVHGDGTLRQLQSPPLPSGEACVLHLRAAFKVGEHLLIEDKQVVIRAGEGGEATFDGRGAVSVPLAREVAEPGPMPQLK